MGGRRNAKTIFLTVDGVGDHAIDFGGGSTVADIAHALVTDSGVPHTLQVVRTGSVLPPALPVDSADIRAGDVVRLIPITAGVDVDDSLVTSCSATLAMQSGPVAGATFELRPGDNSVGRVSTNDVTIVDPSISRHHATVMVSNASVVIEDNGSTNGVSVADELLTEPAFVRSGQQIKLGQSEAVLTHNVVPSAEPDRSHLDIPSPAAARYQGRSVSLPPPPLQSDVGARRTGRLSLGRSQQKQELEQFHSTLANLTLQLEQEHQIEHATRMVEAPSFAQIHQAVSSRTSLWARKVTDPGGIEARVGIGRVQSRLTFEPIAGGPQELRAKLAATVERFSWIDGAPVTIDFRESGSVGVQGPIDQARALAYSLVGQLCATYGPDQLGIAFRPTQRRRHWDWLKWLPHLDFVGSAVGVDDAGFVSWVSGLFDGAAGNGSRPASILLVLDDDRPLPSAVLSRLIQEGPALGIHTLLLSDESRGFDNILGVTVRVADGVASLVREHVDPVVGVLVETCDREQVDGMARLISPIGYRPEASMPRPDAPQADEDVEEQTAQRVTVEAFELGGTPPKVVASLRRHAVQPPDLSRSAEPDTAGTVPAAPAEPVMAAPPIPADPQPTDPQPTDPQPAAPQPAAEPATAESVAAQSAAAGSAPALDLGQRPSAAVPPSPAALQQDGPPPAAMPPAAAPAAPTMPAPPAAASAAAEPPPSAPPTDAPEERPLNLASLPHADEDSRLVLGTVEVDGGRGPAVFALNLPRDRSLGLTGGSNSGRTTALRSVAAAAGMLRVEPAHIPTVYYLDVRGDLESIRALPHVSGAAKNDIMGFRSMVAALEQLLAERAAAFGQAGAATLEDFRARRPDDPVRRVILLVDDISSVGELLDSLHPGRWAELVGKILDIGGNLGIHLIFSANQQSDIAEDHAAKIGRWMRLGAPAADGTPGRPGYAVVGKGRVRFATIDGRSPQAELSNAAG